MRDNDVVAQLTRRPLTDDRDVERLMGELLEKAVVRRLWIMLLDDQWRSTKVLIPIDDLPRDPQAPAAMPMAGPVSAAIALGARIAQIIDQTPAAAVIVAWERPKRDPRLMRWVEGMRRGFVHNPHALRAQLVLSEDGIHLLGEPPAIDQVARYGAARQRVVGQDCA